MRVLLRKTSLAPALLRGSSRRDIHVPSLLARHPCLAPPYATPTLGLLKGTRDRVVWEFLNSESNKALQPLAGFAGWKTAKHFPPQSTPRSVSNLAFENRWVSFALPTLRSVEPRTTNSLHGLSDTTEPPLSGGRMESLRRGASGMDAARAVKGRGRRRHGWPLYAVPRNADGAREVERSETRMQGQDFLVPFGATAKRDSPSRAKPLPQPTRPIGVAQRTQSQKASLGKTRCRFPLLQKASEPLQTAHPVAPARESAARSSSIRAANTGSRASSLLHGLAAALNCKTAFTSQVPKC